MVGINDKHQITAIFCGALTGDFLPVQLVYKGKTSRCHPHFQFPSGWHNAHSPKHWSTEETMLQYIEHIILPYVRQVRERLQKGDDKPAVAIMDNFKGQITEAVTSLLEANNVHFCLLPANTQLIFISSWILQSTKQLKASCARSSSSGTQSM